MKNKRNNLFESIYQQHYPMVFQLCLGFVKGEDDVAKDLSQDVFINIWNNLDCFREESSYKTWIYRITVNTCLQFLRVENRMEKQSISKSENKLSYEIETNDSTGNRHLYEAIGQLNKIDRLIIMMVLDGQDYNSISEILGIKPTNVRVKIHRIKKRIKTIIKK